MTEEPINVPEHNIMLEHDFVPILRDLPEEPELLPSDYDLNPNWAFSQWRFIQGDRFYTRCVLWWASSFRTIEFWTFRSQYTPNAIHRATQFNQTFLNFFTFSCQKKLTCPNLCINLLWQWTFLLLFIIFVIAVYKMFPKMHSTVLNVKGSRSTFEQHVLRSRYILIIMF